MGTAVKKTISLPPDLAKEAEAMAQAQSTTLSAVIQDALRQTRAARLKKELGHVQGYWSQRANQQGLVTENDLQRFLES
jgi:predicted transcriptional regulator